MSVMRRILRAVSACAGGGLPSLVVSLGNLYFCLDRNFRHRIVRAMELSPVARKFVVHWGEMGTAWGVNRTVSQIHALLFFHGRPLHAEDIADTLAVAR